MLDAIDRRIVQSLQTNGRRSNVEVARELGLSESTVRKRLDRMMSNAEVHIASYIEPAAVGYGTLAMIQLTVEINQVQMLSKLIGEMPEVIALHWLTGGHDLALWAVFTDDQHLQRFLAERLGNLPGIVHSQTAHVLRTFKHPYDWVIPDPEQHSVLVADDDPDFVETTRLVLAAQGYAVRTASSGSEAVRSMIANPPTLVIMDVMMEGVLDGWDASGRIRATPALHGTPILVVSSITSSEYASLFPTDEDHLIDNFISKPVAPERLVQEVARLIAQHT